jgi:hypothetical protein
MDERQYRSLTSILNQYGFRRIHDNPYIFIRSITGSSHAHDKVNGYLWCNLLSNEGDSDHEGWNILWMPFKTIREVGYYNDPNTLPKFQSAVDNIVKRFDTGDRKPFTMIKKKIVLRKKDEASDLVDNLLEVVTLDKKLQQRDYKMLDRNPVDFKPPRDLPKEKHNQFYRRQNALISMHKPSYYSLANKKSQKPREIIARQEGSYSGILSYDAGMTYVLADGGVDWLENGYPLHLRRDEKIVRRFPSFYVEQLGAIDTQSAYAILKRMLQVAALKGYGIVHSPEAGVGMYKRLNFHQSLHYYWANPEEVRDLAHKFHVI